MLSHEKTVKGTNIIKKCTKFKRILSLLLVITLVTGGIQISNINTVQSKAAEIEFDESNALVLNFNAMGLPSSTTWGLTINESTYSISITSSGYTTTNTYDYSGDYVVYGVNDTNTVKVTNNTSHKVKLRDLTCKILQVTGTGTGDKNVYMGGSSNITEKIEMTNTSGKLNVYWLDNTVLSSDYAYSTSLYSASSVNMYNMDIQTYTGRITLNGTTNVNMTDCTISGAKITCKAGNVTLDNCILMPSVSNGSTTDTAGLYLNATSTLTVKGSLIKADTPYLVGTSGVVMYDTSLIRTKDFVGYGASTVFENCSYGALVNNKLPATTSYENYNELGQRVYPVYIRVPRCYQVKVKLTVDNWLDTAEIYTDSSGNIFPLLTSGTHSIKIETPDGKTYNLTVSTDEEGEGSVPIIPVETELQTVNVDYADTSYNYKFDSDSEVTVTSTAAKTIDVPKVSGKNSFVLKSNSEPYKLWEAEVASDGAVGTLVVVKPIISSQSSDISIKEDVDTTLKVVATASRSENTLSYKWYKGDTELAETTNSIAVNGGTGLGEYKCVVTESNGLSVESNTITVSNDSSVPQDEYDVLKDKYDDLKDSYDDLKKQYDDLVLENEGSETEIETLKAKITELEVEINQLKVSITEKDGTIASLSTQIEELSAKVVEYETLLAEIRGILGVDTNDDILNKIREILDELSKLKDDYEDLSDEYSDYKEEAIFKINSLTAEVTQLKIDLDATKIDLGVAKEKLKNATEELEDLKSLLTDIRKELDVSDNTDIIPAIKELKDKVSDLESEVDTLKTSLDTANDEINNLKADKDAYGDRLNDLKDQVGADSTDDIEDKIKAMQDLIDEYANKISTLENDKDLLEDTVAKQKEDIDALRATLDSDGQALADRIAELEEEVENLKSKNGQLTDMINVHVENINIMTEEIKTLKDEITRLQTELDTANDTIEDLREKLSAVNVENEELKKENEELKKGTQGKEDLLKQIEELQKQVDNLKKNSTSVEVPTQIEKDAVTVLTTNTNTMVSQDSTSVTAKNGWELSKNVSFDSWTDSLDITELCSRNEVYTFYTGSDLAHTLGVNSTKTVIYAREKTNPNKVYACGISLNSNYTVPKGTMTSSTKGMKFVYNESNKQVVKTTEAVSFNVSGTYSDAGEGSISYKVVAIGNDFDPDGSWIKANNGTFKVKVSEPARVYVKYADKLGNFTVYKTVVIDPTISNNDLTVPILQMNKVVYKNNSYTLGVNTEGGKVEYNVVDSGIATVSKNGKITAKKEGTTKVICSVYDKKNKLAYKYEITVYVKASDKNNLSLKKVTVDANTNVAQMYKRVEVGKSTKLSVKKSDSAKVMYITSDKNVATVNKNGVVKGKSKGYADITVVVYQNDKFYTYVVKVRVSDGTKDNCINQYLK